MIHNHLCLLLTSVGARLMWSHTYPQVNTHTGTKFKKMAGAQGKQMFLLVDGAKLLRA